MGIRPWLLVMVGGENEVVDYLRPIFTSLSPGVGDIARTAGPENGHGTAEQGYSSWLLDLTATVLREDSSLSKFAGNVSDSGEGRWTIKAAIDEAVPVPVLTSALFERFASRGEARFADKLLAAMRFQFGGHLEKVA